VIFTIKCEDVDEVEKDELISGFLLELRRGTVVLCVLAKLQEPAYGYSLITDLSQTGITIEANTLYPLLRRLEAQGLLESSWNTEGAKPRKYYTTTVLGKEVLSTLKKHWHSTAQSMNRILEDAGL
jgi:DNA-binding PadR family transcriptional regulator